MVPIGFAASICRPELPSQVLPVELPLKGLLKQGNRESWLLSGYLIRGQGAREIHPRRFRQFSERSDVLR